MMHDLYIRQRKRVQEREFKRVQERERERERESEFKRERASSREREREFKRERKEFKRIQERHTHTVSNQSYICNTVSYPTIPYDAPSPSTTTYL
jgi:hypothetical protein